MAVEPLSGDELDALSREVIALRLRVAELQRAAARHEDTDGISLPEREELLREAERVAHLGTWTWDVATGRVSWSDEMYRILGITPGSVTPSVDRFFDAVHPEDRERARERSEQAIRDGVLPLVDCRIVRPDGSIRHTTSSSSMLFDANGVARRIVGGVLDRTDSLLVETKLRSTLALLEEAQRFARLGSWRFDTQTNELEWSQEFRRIAGLPMDLVPNVELFLERVVPEDRARFRARHAQAIAQLQGGELEGRLEHPDGTLRHVRLTGHAFVRPDGSSELRGTMLDVSDQVRLREELAHSQKMEAVGRLAGGIAHDFNNLLTVITANLEVLASRIGHAPELDNSLQALSSAASLTRRLLAFGRKAQLSLRLVAPNVFVRSTMSLMQRLVGDELRLELDLAPGLPQVRMDPLEMERALVNLVVNARDAMPGGGIVRIGTALQQVDGRLQVQLSVADQGRGITEADRPHIFEPFFTTREQAGGSGLGLATVLGTAEQHGGTVTVTPRPGGGTIFTIVLPAVELVPEPEAVSGSAPPAAAPSRTRSLQLLVVDDDARVAEVTRRILAMHGHSVRVATEPARVLELWPECGATTDLVICDVAMAQMRGPELIARLSAGGQGPRVLYITGYSEELVHAELGHPVLPKPFTAATLLRAVQDALAS